MSIDIPADLQSFISQELQLGCFESEHQVVVEGLKLLRAEREETLAGIQAGLADAEEGRFQPLREVFDDLRREFGIDAAT